ncbi:MAG: putative glycoside hydrolase [bacterium]|nr:putative glycoside hydrolase [bacterium]
MKYLLFLLILAAGVTVFLSASWRIEVTVAPTLPAASLDAPEASQAGNQKTTQATPKITDIENQKPLADAPEIIKAIYFTGWSAGNSAKIKYLIDLKKTTEINAVVIDLKDYSGYVGYDIQVPEVEKYEAKEIKIPFINRLVKQLHDEGIYVIARITVFQDPRLAKARPDLTVESKKTGGSWLDNKKLAWIDPAAKDAWDYNIAIAKDAASRGFDELNFDYIRFPSDGDLEDMGFPFWQKTRTDADLTRTNAETKSEVIRNFFKYLRQQLPGVKISADLFGLTTINQDDLGIGQIIEDAFEYFDFVSPMVYPSHYASGFLGYKNPALYPYEVIKYSLDSAIKRLIEYSRPQIAVSVSSSTAVSSVTASSTNNQQTFDYPMKSKIRPWLQDFNLGATYDASMITKQIQATQDSLGDNFNGWMLWNPSNVYIREALER